MTSARAETAAWAEAQGIANTALGQNGIAPGCE